VSALDDAFARVFGRPPEFRTRAPGRVNLIGEHTDYNAGLVLPAAIARSVTIAAAVNGSDRIRLYSMLDGARAEFSARAPGAALLPGWARYPQGVAVGFAARGLPLRGVDAAIGGALPIGAGLSSSAALELASALLLEHAAGISLPPRDRARLCHEAEVSFVGVPCGIMDQFACSLGRAGHALFLDCRSLETHHIPFPPGIVVAVCDTGIRRAVSDSPYAARRQECDTAVRWLQARGSAIRTLRDLSPEDLSELDAAPDPLARRVRHVVTENARVIESAQALEGGDVAALREIFLASHRSLRDDYAVGRPELDAMVEAALDAPGCRAARMTGAGFGGAVVALVHRDDADRFLATAEERYRRRGFHPGVLFTSETASGARTAEIHA